MNRQIKTIILTLILAVAFVQCNTNSIEKTMKLLASDPFASTIVPSETFNIDSKQDNVIEGKNGTIVICPKDCFKNAKGEVVEGDVQIELAEALSLEDMILSNLTTTSDGKPLETDGMIYFNATSNGEQLVVNKDNPVHITIPTAEKKQGMMAYRGIRDENGNMNWADPKPIDNFLQTVDINTLDFLPEGFHAEVEKGLPYKGHEVATQELTDSLYYALDNPSWTTESFIPTDYNEPYYNANKKVENGKYTKDSYTVNIYDSIDRVRGVYPPCGIQPPSIKVIKSAKYQNTFIATKEFEARMKTIRQSCDTAVLEIYVNNLGKNFYELDSMAARYCDEKGKHQCFHEFDNFSKQRLTNVKDADKYSELLKGYYEKQLKKVRAELEKNKEKAMKALQEKNEEAQKIADDYKKLLLKREQYRMDAYGFTWTQTGWINIDNGTLPKPWEKKPVDVVVENGKQFDRVYTYIVYSSIKSLYRMNTTDNVNFYAGNIADKEMLVPKREPAVAIAIGYKEDVPALAMKIFDTGTDLGFALTLAPSTLEELKKAIRPYEKYQKENRISKDLAYMAKLYEEKQRQQELRRQSDFIARLWNLANQQCCGEGGPESPRDSLGAR